jgi:hypothetical protein
MRGNVLEIENVFQSKEEVTGSIPGLVGVLFHFFVFFYLWQEVTTIHVVRSPYDGSSSRILLLLKI